MAINETIFKQLVHSGFPQSAARVIADPAEFSTNKGAAVTSPAALTAPTTMNTVYTQAEVQNLRNDVAALRTVVINLLTSLRDAGLLNP